MQKVFSDRQVPRDALGFTAVRHAICLELRPLLAPLERRARRGPFWAALLAVLLAWSIVPAAGCAGAEPDPATILTGTVLRVIDGDSALIQVGDESLEVRLDAIDAPEYDAPFGQEAKQSLKRHAEGRDVELVIKDHDRYDRPVARVVLEGKDISLLLVSEGLAWHYTRYSDDAELARAEVAARAARRGLWSLDDPVPPWEARQRRRETEAKAGSTGERPGLDDAAFHGNRNSRIFHAPHCPHFRCKNCTVRFMTREDALAAGFRPAGDCRP